MAPNQVAGAVRVKGHDLDALPLEAPGKDQTLAVTGIGNGDHATALRRCARRGRDGVRRKKRECGRAAELAARPCGPWQALVSRRSTSLVSRLAQRIRPDALLAWREHPAGIERVLEPLVGAHGGMIVEVELRRDEVHLGNVGAVAGECRLCASSIRGLAERAGARALIGVVAIEDDRAGVDEDARGGAGQAAIMVEAGGVESPVRRR